VVDISAADIDIQITAVVAILEELHLNAIPRLLVFNKCDRMSPPHVESLCRRYGAIGVSALQPATLCPLLAQLETRVRALPIGEHQTTGLTLQDDALVLASRR
jgi:GTP-binding protein HflX